MEVITNMKHNFTTYMITAGAALAISAGMATAADEVHVSQTEAMHAATSKFEPEYPAIAKQLHLEGSVQVEAHINETGAVESVKPLTGNAVLMNAAVAAVKRWKFAPFTADGKPVRAVADMSFKFSM
jgi:TonB family protein